MNMARNGFRPSAVLQVQLPTGKRVPLTKARELAVVEHNSGRFQSAEALYKAILKSVPMDWWALNYLGEIDNLMGSFKPALGYLQQAARLNPLSSEIFNNLGNSQRGLGEFAESLTSYQSALKLKPDYVAAINNYALSLKALGRLTESEDLLQRAVQIDPGLFEGYLNLAALIEEQNRPREAFVHYTNALKLRPDDGSVLKIWGRLFRREVYAIHSYDEFIFQMVSRCLDHPEIFVSEFARPTYHLLRLHPTFSRIQEQVRSEGWEQEIVYSEIERDLSSIPLLHQIMALSHAINPELEGMFTRLRHAMINSLVSTKDDQVLNQFSISMAILCFSNDFVFSESEGETETINKIASDLQNAIENGLALSLHKLIALSSYRPLHQFEWSNQLLSLSLPDDLKDLLRQQVIEREEEKQIIKQIPLLGRIDNEVSRAVQNMYESSPYPRWVKPTTGNECASIHDELLAHGIELPSPRMSITSETKILVAGCGTGQHAIMVASRYPQSQVIAVDLSRSSLAYAARKTQEIGITNIRYIHGDLLQLSNLGMLFDVIECVGVLHHMDDPLIGWRALSDVLKPSGIMKIGLYSERARQTIVRIRDLIATQGLDSRPDQIRQLRQELMSMADEGNKDMQELMGIRDFFSLNECIDLLFHVQEHRFSFIQIESNIKELGLHFLGQILPDQVLMERFLLEQGSDADINNLAQWDEFERRNPYTFIGMYVFWVSKDGYGKEEIIADPSLS